MISLACFHFVCPTPRSPETMSSSNQWCVKSVCVCVCVCQSCHDQTAEDGDLGRKADGLRHKDCSHQCTHRNTHITHTHTLAYGAAVVLFLRLSELTPCPPPLSLFLSLSLSPFCAGSDAFHSQPGSWEVNSGANCFDILLFVLASWC